MKFLSYLGLTIGLCLVQQTHAIYEELCDYIYKGNITEAARHIGTLRTIDLQAISCMSEPGKPALSLINYFAQHATKNCASYYPIAKALTAKGITARGADAPAIKRLPNSAACKKIKSCLLNKKCS